MGSSGFCAQGIEKPRSSLCWAGLLALGSEKESVSKAIHVGRRLHCLVHVGLKSPFSWLLALGWEVPSASRGHPHSLSRSPLHLQAGSGAPHPSHALTLCSSSLFCYQLEKAVCFLGLMRLCLAHLANPRTVSPSGGQLRHVAYEVNSPHIVLGIGQDITGNLEIPPTLTDSFASV